MGLSAEEAIKAPTQREVVRMTYAMIDLYCRSYPRPPAAVTFDIDDTCDVAHGHQQLALFHAYSWLRVSGTTERSQIDQRVRHQLHTVVPLLFELKAQQQPLEFILPRENPLYAYSQ
jgi:hypothetical protein